MLKTLNPSPKASFCWNGQNRIDIFLLKSRNFVICNAKRTSQIEKKQREVVVGIDLGTTNSAVAIVKNGKPFCIPNKNGDKVTPSVVTILQDGQVVVGRDAKRLAVQHPLSTFYSVKRLIGRELEDLAVKEEAKRVAFKVVQDSEGCVALRCDEVPSSMLYPEEVSAQVLATLLADAERHTQARVTKAVISVPAYFNEKQREATIAAGKLAGLEVVRLIAEPVAAALAYGLDLTEDQVVLVFDLGGGTLDISLLEVGNGTVEVLSTGGDPRLGGDDWDNVIVAWLTKQYLRKSAGVNTADPQIAASLRSLAEYAKITLSQHDTVVLKMPIGGPKGGPLEVSLSRNKFEELSTDLWRRCRLPLDMACWQAGVDLGTVAEDVERRKREVTKRQGKKSAASEEVRPVIRPKQHGNLSRILLVGGATRMPAVPRFLENMTGLKPDDPAKSGLDPDQAVALGAAVQAGVLQGEVSNVMVMDQWQASLMRVLAELKLRQDSAASDERSTKNEGTMPQDAFSSSRARKQSETRKISEGPQALASSGANRQQRRKQRSSMEAGPLSFSEAGRKLDLEGQASSQDTLGSQIDVSTSRSCDDEAQDLNGHSKALKDEVIDAEVDESEEVDETMLQDEAMKQIPLARRTKAVGRLRIRPRR